MGEEWRDGRQMTASLTAMIAPRPPWLNAILTYSLLLLKLPHETNTKSQSSKEIENLVNENCKYRITMLKKARDEDTVRMRQPYAATVATPTCSGTFAWFLPVCQPYNVVQNPQPLPPPKEIPKVEQVEDIEGRRNMPLRKKVMNSQANLHRKLKRTIRNDKEVRRAIDRLVKVALKRFSQIQPTTSTRIPLSTEDKSSEDEESAKSWSDS